VVVKQSETLEKLLKAKIPGEETGIEVKKTICPVCTNNCGMNVYIKDGILIKVEGASENPVNDGTLCAKGAATRQYVYHKDRIKMPLLRKGDRNSTAYEPISWDAAFDIISSRLLKIKAEYGPESVVFFSGFPKLLRPFLQRLAHGFGSPNFCSESSACFFSTAVANILNYGCNLTSHFDKSTKCLMVWSANPFHSGTPRVRGLLDAIDNGLKVIEVGPFVTPLSSKTELHLRLRPGTSGALALGMAHVIIEENLYDKEFIENWSVGFDSYRSYVKSFPPSETEKITGVPAASIIEAARLYATSKPAAILTSASPTVHHTNGLQNHRAITALIGLTGNFDKPGGSYDVPTSYYHNPTGLITREHEFEQIKSFKEMPPRIGQDSYPIWCKTIAEAQAMHLPFQIESQKPYPIKALVGFGLNYRMWPGSDFMRNSLKKLDFLVDVDLFMTDSARLSDLVLPACTSMERSDLRIWPSRYATWTEPVIKPLGESRPDIDIIIELAKHLGLNDSLLQEGQERCLDWIFEPSGIKIADIKEHSGGFFLKNREMPPFEKYKVKGFASSSGKMEFASSLLEEEGIEPLPQYNEPKLSPVSTPETASQFPLVLNTGSRLPMFLHSRTFRLSWTRNLRPDPMLDIHPQDAEERMISQGDWVRLETPKNKLKVKANLTKRMLPGVVAMIHDHPEADVNTIIESDYLDPITGFAGFKSLLCEVSKTTNY
jgi:anaerobic selenocysteine-containing dehydrogenase